jgi:hypothetical protein
VDQHQAGKKVQEGITIEEKERETLCEEGARNPDEGKMNALLIV